MNIQEAVKQSLETGKKIVLEQTTGLRYSARILLKPTNTGDRCIIYFEENGKEVSKRRGWQPTAADLLSVNYELAEKDDNNQEKIEGISIEIPED